MAMVGNNPNSSPSMLIALFRNLSFGVEWPSSYSLNIFSIGKNLDNLMLNIILFLIGNLQLSAVSCLLNVDRDREVA